jgi:hypothetical protein
MSVNTGGRLRYRMFKNTVETVHKEKFSMMQQYINILLFHIYMKLRMFRATYRPSSGA